MNVPSATELDTLKDYNDDVLYIIIKKKTQLAQSPAYIVSPVYLESALCAMLGGRDIKRTKIGSLLSEFTTVTHKTTCNHQPATEQAFDTSVS